MCPAKTRPTPREPWRLMDARASGSDETVRGGGALGETPSLRTDPLPFPGQDPDASGLIHPHPAPGLSRGTRASGSAHRPWSATGRHRVAPSPPPARRRQRPPHRRPKPHPQGRRRALAGPVPRCGRGPPPASGVLREGPPSAVTVRFPRRGVAAAGRVSVRRGAVFRPGPSPEGASPCRPRHRTRSRVG